MKTIPKTRVGRLALFAALLALAMGLFGVGDAPAILADGTHPGLTPASVNVTLFPGDTSEDIAKTVHTPEIPPLLDVCLLEDESGSFGDDIANLQGGTTATDIYNAIVTGAGVDAEFAVAGFRDYPTGTFGSPGDHVYRLLSSMDPSLASWLAGIAALTAAGGNDTPEAQYDAIVAAASGPTDYPDAVGPQNDCGWREGMDATHVLVVATDAPFHTPDGTHINDSASTIAALNVAAGGEGIVVIGLTAPGAGPELGVLAAATGGSTQALSSDGSDIADAILAGLEAVTVDVSMASNCAATTGGIITTSFVPASVLDVVSGEHAVFTETITVAANAPGGTYVCQDWALINGSPMTDPTTGLRIDEVKTIKVPEGFLTGGGNIDNGNGKNAERISWGGNVGFLADASLVGQWQTNFHNVGNDDLDGAKFHSTAITSLQFFDDGLDGPNPPPANANVAIFTASGRLNNVDGYTLEVCIADRGEPGRQHDSVQFELTSPGGVVLYNSLTDFDSEDATEGCDRHLLDGGNAQIHSGLKGS